MSRFRIAPMVLAAASLLPAPAAFSAMPEINPFFQVSTRPFQLSPFDRIREERAAGK